MKKILFILLCFVSVQMMAQNGKDYYGTYVWWDTIYFKRVPYNSGSGVVHLGIDTVAASPTFGKLVRKTASGATYTASLGVTLVGNDFRLANTTKSKAVTIEAPSSSEAIDMWQTPVAITVTSLKAILRGSSPSVTYNIRFGTDITSSTDVFTANITCTSVTTGCSNSSGFNDATIPAGSFIWVITSAMSGTVNSISLTLNYTED